MGRNRVVHPLILEKAIHEILYCRGVYSIASFENVVSNSGGEAHSYHFCRYPSVRDYVSGVLTHAKPLLRDRKLSKLSVLVHGAGGGSPVERVDFAFRAEKRPGEPKGAERIRARGGRLLSMLQVALDPTMGRRARCRDLDRQGTPFDVVLTTVAGVDERDVPADWVGLAPPPAVRGAAPALEAMPTKVKLGPVRLSWSFTHAGHASTAAAASKISQGSMGSLDRSQYEQQVNAGW